MKHPFFAGLPHPRVIAHRGWLAPDLSASGAVENSVAAVAAAVEIGADIIESDCHITADGIPILVHDADLLRVVGDPRAVADVSLAELTEIFRDRGGLLTLENAFTLFPQARFNIDVKAEKATAAAGRVLGQYGTRALVNSFSDKRRKRALTAAARSAHAHAGLYSGLPATASGTSVTAKLMLACALGRFGSAWAQKILKPIDAVQIPERQYGLPVLTPRLIAEAHRAGVEVHVWTINDGQRMRQLVQMGVDGIVTDQSDIALQQFSRH